MAQTVVVWHVILMARIRNTDPERRPVRRLYDEETMGEHYDPPGIHFNEQDGTVAQIKEDALDAVVGKFDHFEPVEESNDDYEAEPTEEEEVESAEAEAEEAEPEEEEAEEAESEDDEDTES